DVVLSGVGRDRFASAPAAIRHHHAYLQGLLEHSLEVAEIAVALAAKQPYAGLIDRDMVVVGALCHDVGKTETYEWLGVPIRISTSGYLRSHVARGAEMVTAIVAEEPSGLRPADVDLLRHIIESHHGQLDWGSPTPPRCLE